MPHVFIQWFLVSDRKWTDARSEAPCLIQCSRARGPHAYRGVEHKRRINKESGYNMSSGMKAVVWYNACSREWRHSSAD